jgi:hypothetical protein
MSFLKGPQEHLLRIFISQIAFLERNVKACLPPDPGSAGSVVEALKGHGSVVDKVATGLDWRTSWAHAAARSTTGAFAVTTTTTTTVTSGITGIFRHNVWSVQGCRSKCLVAENGGVEGSERWCLQGSSRSVESEVR